MRFALLLILALAFAFAAEASPSGPMETGHRDLDRLSADIEAIPQAVEAAVDQGLERLGLEITRDVVEYLDEHGVNVDGTLRKSVRHEVKRELGKLELRAGAYAAYAAAVHDGSKPHWAPIAPVRRWVRKKLGVSPTEREEVDVAFSTKAGDSVEFTARPLKLERVARGVQRKIATAGTEPVPFVDAVLDQYRDVITPRLTQHVVNAIETRLST